MKRSLVMIGIAFLLVISIAYAGVLEYYGKIVGTANVQGPIFYASTKSVDYGYELFINSLPNEYKGTLSISSVNFYSQPLGVSNWYPSTWKIIIHYDNSKSPNKLTYSLYFSNSGSVDICSGTRELDVGSDKVMEIDCSFSGGSIPNDSSLWLSLSTAKGFDKLYADGSTRVEVSKA